MRPSLCTEKCPVGHESRVFSLDNLGGALVICFNTCGDIVRRLASGSALRPSHHPYCQSILMQRYHYSDVRRPPSCSLAVCCSRRAEQSQDRFARVIRYASIVGPKVPRNDLIAPLRRNGRILASASYDDTAQLWNLGNNQCISSPLHHASCI
ncbi:hypothetical protein BDR03DRAFT_298835 [Suillus americanus]|nr:hypothetical protein BDR03DRAFT_298835 [Suillus americanus]